MGIGNGGTYSPKLEPLLLPLVDNKTTSTADANDGDALFKSEPINVGRPHQEKRDLVIWNNYDQLVTHLPNM